MKQMYGYNPMIRRKRKPKRKPSYYDEVGTVSFPEGFDDYDPATRKKSKCTIRIRPRENEMINFERRERYLNKARAAGIHRTVDGDDLVVEAPAAPHPSRRSLFVRFKWYAASIREILLPPCEP